MAGRHTAPLPDNLVRKSRPGTCGSLASTEVAPPTTVKSSPPPRLLDPDYDFDAQVPEDYFDTLPSPRQLFKASGSTDELGEPMGSDGAKPGTKRPAEPGPTPGQKGGDSVDEPPTKRIKSSPPSGAYDKYYHQSLDLIMISSFCYQYPPCGFQKATHRVQRIR